MGTKRTTFKIWEPLAKSLEEKMEQAFLRRDGFLNNLISQELDVLIQECENVNSPEVSSHIQKMLKDLKLVTVSMSLDTALIEKLNQTCASKNIIRDAFINRLILYLVASPQLISHIFFDDDDWRKRVLKESYNFIDEIEIFEPIYVPSHPFENLRAALLSEDLDRNFYTRVFREGFPSQKTNLSGFNCLMSDVEVPDSEAQVKFKTLLESI